MTRAVIPNRREAEVFSFEHNGIAFSGSVSRRQEDWRVVEVFLDGGKPGTAVQSVARDTAVAASLALQHGTPIEVLRQALTRNDDGTPAGPLGALLDLVDAA
jgi:hypothetical protein